MSAEIDEKNPEVEETVPSMQNIEVKSHRERPIPPGSVRGLYDHVGWDRPATEEELAGVLAAGPAAGAWNRGRLVGFARALSDGHLAAYVEDVMVHEAYRRRRREGQSVLRATRRPVLRSERFSSNLVRASG